jgi:hypothetical protein
MQTLGLYKLLRRSLIKVAFFFQKSVTTTTTAASSSSSTSSILGPLASSLSELIWDYRSVRPPGRRSARRYLYRTTQTQQKSGQASILRVGFEPTIPIFEQAKIFHNLDGAATVTGKDRLPACEICSSCGATLPNVSMLYDVNLR